MKEGLRFLDTNILLRFLTRDDEAKAQRCRSLLKRVETGEVTLATSHLVIFETIFTLQSYYQVPRPQIQERVGDLISMRGLRLPGKSVYRTALEVFASQNISFTDAFNAAYMQSKDIAEIYSYDTDFDRLQGIARVEP